MKHPDIEHHGTRYWLLVVALLPLLVLPLELGAQTRRIDPDQRIADDHRDDVLPDRAAGILSAGGSPSFIRNDGQWNRQAKFLLRSPGLDLWITESGVVYDINRVDTRAPVFITFEGSRNDAGATGTSPLDEYHNYFIGNDRSRWAEQVPLFRRVHLQGVYTGIDALFYLDGGRPRYDLVVAPGADPSHITMKIEGATGVSVESSGALRIVTALGTIEQRGLFAYQEIEGERRRISCAFVAGTNGRVRFDLGEYDRTRPLVIDPLVYSTYLGGSGDDHGRGITVDRSNNAYICGTTGSADFPVTPGLRTVNAGARDAFVTKLKSSGARVYSTYLGGSGDDDQARGIAVSDSGHAFITGVTNSTNFPTRNAMQPTSGGGSDAFVARLTESGGLTYSTYLGGAADDRGAGIGIDVSGQAYVAGSTLSSNFPRKDAMQQFPKGGVEGFMTKLTDRGAIHLSTYIGGNGDDYCHAIAVDQWRSIFLTGQTTSTNFPVNSPTQATHGGGIDLFITRLGLTGSLGFSTYAGGSGDDIGTAIDIDGLSNMYVTGHTTSTNYPTRNASQPNNAGGVDIIVQKHLNHTVLAYSTYLGNGTGDDYGYGIDVDDSGIVHIAGMTRSTNFRTVAPIQSIYGGGAGDGFVMTLSDSGAIDYSTYLGGNGEDAANAVAIDRKGGMYITGSTEATNYPTRYASQQASGGGIDAFVTRISKGPIIELLTPLPGTLWCAGSSNAITWISSGVSAVTIDISGNGGAGWTELVAGADASTGSYSWQIPSNQPAGTDYRLRIRDAGNAAIVDSSRAGFTISVPPVASITSPPAPTVTAFSDVTFTATATGTPTPTVRWQSSIDGIAYTDIPGARSNTLSYSSVRRESHQRYYRAVYSNACGTSNTPAVFLTVDKAAASVVLTDLEHLYDGTMKEADAITTPPGLAVDFTYSRDGAPVSAPTAVGSYDVTGVINDTNYHGTASGILVIALPTAVPERIGEPAAGITARVVPNPLGIGGEIHIEGLPPGRLEATIHDIAGDRVGRMGPTVSGGGSMVLPIDTGELASGFYTVRVATERGAITVKVRIIR